MIIGGENSHFPEREPCESDDGGVVGNPYDGIALFLTAGSLSETLNTPGRLSPPVFQRAVQNRKNFIPELAMTLKPQRFADPSGAIRACDVVQVNGTPAFCKCVTRFRWRFEFVPRVNQHQKKLEIEADPFAQKFANQPRNWTRYEIADDC